MSVDVPAHAGGRLERLVTRARRLDVSLRIAEAACLGACAALVCVAAARVEGAALAGHVWFAAIATGLCAAATWTIERARSVAAFVRVLDRRLGLEGALVTAWDRRFAASAVATLLSRRVALVIATRGHRAVMHSVSPAWIAAPLLGGAVLALVSESRSNIAWRAQLADDAVAIATAGAVDTADDPQVRLRIDALATDVRAWLDQDPEDVGQARGAGLSRLEEYERRARTLAEQLPVEQRGGLERLADRIERVRAAIGGGLGDGGAHPSDAGSTMAVAGIPEPWSVNGVGESNLTSMPAVGTMVRPSSVGESPARIAAAEGGVGAVRWWPPAYDGLVARWLAPKPPASR